MPNSDAYARKVGNGQIAGHSRVASYSKSVPCRHLKRGAEPLSCRLPHALAAELACHLRRETAYSLFLLLAMPV